MSHLQSVAVIGGGLGGCAVAIALAKQGAQVTVYESRSKNAEGVHSGVVLSPNGLRVLDHLGLYSRIKDKCYTTKYRIFKNDRDETVKKVVSADPQVHGYCNHRLWRSILLDEMRAMLDELGVVVEYKARFERTITNDEEGVSFSIAGRTHHASLLIASDGIHSTVRKYIAPDVEPCYTGTTAVLAHIPWTSVAWPYEDYERNATIQGKPSAIFWVPEDPETKVIMTGMQIQHPEQSREDLAQLQRDKDKLLSFYRKGYEDHGPTARSIIDAVAANKQSCYIWPFMTMPKLERWYSDSGKVIMVGDAAHTLPPSSAQGVNQALEDAYTLTLILGSYHPEETGWMDRLKGWQSRRQQRIDAIFDWATNTTNVARLPEEDRERLRAEGKLKDNPSDQSDAMAWLYGYDAARDFAEML